MKQIIPIISSAWLLNACATPANLVSQAANSAANCSAPTALPLSTLKADSYSRFKYHIHNIVADANTIRFQTLKNDFVFCRGNNNWSIQPGTISRDFIPAQNQQEIIKELTNPDYKNISFKEKTYQYRVTTEPKFVVGAPDTLSRPSVTPEQDQIVFELITPNSKLERHTLYTLKDLQQIAKKSGYEESGVQLGFPRITAAVTHGDRLWWAIAFEQGEGNNGLATIVSYEPQKEKVEIIQPQELWWQQITDLAITGDADNLTFWLGTNISGEGNSYIPAKGLVAYRPAQQPNSGTTSYNVNNSPLIGAIPDQLHLEGDTLWVGSGNGVCKIKWQTANDSKSWSCWRFGLIAKLPSDEIPLYSSLMSKTPAPMSLNTENVEILWWMPVDFQNRQGRYEVKYPLGFTVKLDQGASLEQFNRLEIAGKPPVYWSGREWHWHGDRFVRGLDEVAQNEVGGGPQGIGPNFVEPNVQTDWNAIRGDLDLIQLSPKSTTVKHYSGWVDENLLKPYLTVLPQEPPRDRRPNPLTSIAKQLQP